MLYNIVLISAIHQHESAIGVHMSPPSWNLLLPPTPSHPSRSSQSTGLSSRCHVANSHWLSILHLGLLGEISITSDMQTTQPLWQKVIGTQKPLDEGESGEWKSWLKAQHSENEDHGIWSHHFMANRWGSSVTLYFLAPKSLQNVIAAMKLKDAYSLEEKLWPT